MTIKTIHFAFIVVLGIVFQPVVVPGQGYQGKPQPELSGAIDSINITPPFCFRYLFWPMSARSEIGKHWVSFYSGHTSTTAAISFYVARVFSDYLADNTAKIFIWAGAAIYPALVGYLRRDSGHHFRTDVMTGYAIGAAIGYFIPELHKVSKNEQLSVNFLYSGEFAGIGVAYNFYGFDL